MTRDAGLEVSEGPEEKPEDASPADELVDDELVDDELVDDELVDDEEPAGGSDPHAWVGPARTSLPMLTRVEMRKMVDTRSGFWLLVTIALVSTVVGVISLLAGDAADHDARDFLQTQLIPSGLLLPVLGILMVTSEWSQRTALTTFTLVPARGRVLVSKLTAAVLLAIAATVVAVVVALVLTLLAVVFTGDGSWSLTPADLGGAVLFEVVRVVLGVGFGLLLLNSPVAIVLFFVLPTVWTVLRSAISGFEDVAAWLDITAASTQLVDASAMGPQEWGQLATSGAVWVLLPLLIGTWRLLTSELK